MSEIPENAANASQPLDNDGPPTMPPELEKLFERSRDAADRSEAIEGLLEKFLPTFEQLLERELGHLGKPSKPTVMEQILELSLVEVEKSLGDSGQVPHVQCAIVFKDGSVSQGVVKRGPLPSTYVIAQPAGEPGPNGQMIPSRDKVAETCFLGKDIRRIAHVRAAQRDLAVVQRSIITPPH